MVRIHQACAFRDNAVPVVIRVVAEGDVKAVFQADQPGHCIRRRAIHSNFAVAVNAHERERRVNIRIHDRHVQFICFRNRLPEGDARPAHRVNADIQTGGANCVEINNLFQIFDIRADVVVLMRGGRFHRDFEADALDAVQSIAQKIVGAVLNDFRNRSIRRAAGWRIIFETTVTRRIMRGRNHDTVGQSIFFAAIIGQNRMRNHGRRRIAETGLQHHLNVICGKDFDGRNDGRFGQRVGIHADEQRPGDVLSAAIVANRLRYRENMVFVKAAVQRRAAMPGRAERDLLVRIGDIRLAGVIGGDQTGNIFQ